MALTMDERCENLKDFGAKFHERVEDCEDNANHSKKAFKRASGMKNC